MFFIESKRLRLLPLTHHQLQLLAQSRSALEISLGLTPSNMRIAPFYQAEFDEALQTFCLPQTALHPQDYYWYTTWEMILLSENKSIGGIGVGAPNSDGGALLGFFVDEAYQQQGFASEATLRLADWYFEQPGTKVLLATTFPDNTASVKTLERCGFVYQKEAEGLLHFRMG